MEYQKIKNNFVFVDTAAWIALLNRDDEWHIQATRIQQDLLLQGVRFITTDYVIAEVANALSRASQRKAVIQFVERIKDSKRCEIIHIDEILFERGWTIYKTILDKDWSLTDCISFAVMQRRKLAKAFTCDHHFEQAGFIAILKR